MKRILAIAAISLTALLCASEISAQRLGVTAGANFTSMQNIDKSSATGYAVGVTSQFKLPLGFSIQPSLLYSSKVSEVGESALTAFKMNVGYLELPVSVQWGPDLLIFRPFVDVSPYIGYALHSNFKTVADDVDLGLDNLNQIKDEAMEEVKDGFRNMLNDLEYGLGVGAGVEVWRFQLLCRYNWNLGPLVKAVDTEVPQIVQNQINDAVKGKNFGGVSLTLTYMFGK